MIATCDNWGHTSAAQTINPDCKCLMCERMRHTLNNLTKQRKKKR